jgi:pimeloyl-ACP methyl ester carboxylesterase
MAAGIAHHRIKVGSIETEVLEEGAGGPNLLFLHSSWGPTVLSSDYIRLLSTKYRVIAPYHPGFGRIARPKTFRDVGDLAYFYLDFLEQRNLSDVVLVGASLGGWVASEIAVRSTSRINRLVLISPFGVKVRSREERDFADFFALDAADRAAIEFEDQKFWTSDYSAMSDEDLTIIARGREAEVHYGWKPFMHNPQLRNWIHRVSVPTLVIRGANDKIVSQENHIAYRDLLPDSKLVTIDHAGHHPHIEQPQAFVQQVVAFAS